MEEKRREGTQRAPFRATVTRGRSTTSPVRLSAVPRRDVQSTGQKTPFFCGYVRNPICSKNLRRAYFFGVFIGSLILFLTHLLVYICLSAVEHFGLSSANPDIMVSRKGAPIWYRSRRCQSPTNTFWDGISPSCQPPPSGW